MALIFNNAFSAVSVGSVANVDGTLETDGVEWRAVQEGFRLLDKDLSKLQVRHLPRVYFT